MPRNLFTRPPETPIEFLAQSVRRYLYLPDPGALYVLMGAVAGSMLAGQRIYLMLVGPPSAGGTVLLDMLTGMPGVIEAGLIESPAAFLSGTGKRDKAKDATGGLLANIGAHGAIVMKDFTSIISLAPDIRRKVLAVLREAFDGAWTRPVGTDGGRELKWAGRLACFGKVTSEIDQHSAVNATLGERWVYYRFPPTDGWAQARAALLNTSRSGWKEELRCLTHAMFEALDLGYGGRHTERLGVRRELTELEIARLINLASIVVKCRSAVSRDSYTHEVNGAVEAEQQTRLAEELSQLYIGMEVIGVGRTDRWRLIEKVAFDSMPRMRRMVIDACREGDKTYSQLRKIVGCSHNVISRTIEDLELHGVVDVRMGGGLPVESEGGKVDKSAYKVRLTEWMAKEWAMVRRAHK